MYRVSPSFSIMLSLCVFCRRKRLMHSLHHATETLLIGYLGIGDADSKLRNYEFLVICRTVVFLSFVGDMFCGSGIF